MILSFGLLINAACVSFNVWCITAGAPNALLHAALIGWHAALVLWLATEAALERFA